MPFCDECGRELKEGEVCNCKKKNIKSKITVILGAIIMIVGCFMPFYKVSIFGLTTGVALADGDDGKIVIAFTVVIILLAIFKLIKLSIIFAIINICITFADLSGFNNEELYGLIDIGVGAYIIIIGAIMVIIGSVIGWKFYSTKISLVELYKYLYEKISITNKKNGSNVWKSHNKIKQNISSVDSSDHLDKKVIVCSNCGTLCEKDSSFCVKCGSKLEVLNQEICIHCGRSIKKGDKFCIHCGGEL